MGGTGSGLRELDDHAIQTMARFHQNATSPSSEIHIQHFGGAIARVGEDETAHRGLRDREVRPPTRADLRPATAGLPDDLCPCPHWGCMIKGPVRMHTLDGHQDFAAGEAFYWAPGHAPEALEDFEYVDFSPTEQFRPVIEHITSGAGASS